MKMKDYPRPSLVSTWLTGRLHLNFLVQVLTCSHSWKWKTVLDPL